MTELGCRGCRRRGLLVLLAAGGFLLLPLAVEALELELRPRGESCQREAGRLVWEASGKSASRVLVENAGPGSFTLTPPEASGTVRLDSEQCWMAPVELPAGQQIVRRELLALGRILFEVRGASSARRAQPRLRFARASEFTWGAEPFPWEARCTEERSGNFRCDLPEGQLHAVVELPGAAPEYLFDRTIDPSRVLPLGPLEPRVGASLAGFIEAGRGEVLPSSLEAILGRVGGDPLEPLASASVLPNGFFQLAGLRSGLYLLQIRKGSFPVAGGLSVELTEGSELRWLPPLRLQFRRALEVSVSPVTAPEERRWQLVLERHDPEGVVGGFLKEREVPVPINGIVRVDGLLPRVYRVLLHAPGFCQPCSSAQVDLRELELEDAFLELEVPWLEFAGTLISRNALAEGKLEFSRPVPDGWGYLKRQVEVSENGTFGGVVPLPGFWRVVWKPAAGGEVLLDAVELRKRSDGRPVRIELELPTASIEGRVVDATSGEPVSGVEVEVAESQLGQPLRTLASATTSIHGEFSLPWLRPGVVRLRGWHSGETPEGGVRTRVTESLELQLSRDSEVRVELRLRPTGTLRGVLREGGSFVPQGRVRCGSAGGFGPWLQESDGRIAAGRRVFELDLPAGRAICAVLAGRSWGLRAVTIEEGRSTEVDWNLEPGGGTLLLELRPPGEVADPRKGRLVRPVQLWADGIELPMDLVQLFSLAHWDDPEPYVHRLVGLEPGRYFIGSPGGSFRPFLSVEGSELRVPAYEPIREPEER